jgi:hypothetical protein
MQFIKKIGSRFLVATASGATVLLTAGQAQAAAIDVSAVVTTIGDQATPIGLIGGAVLAIVVGVKAFKWVRAALS